jgi:dCTP diphosphatase
VECYDNSMSDFKKLQNEIIKFRDERDWKQFHNPKDMAISLTLEAAELLEHFQWKNTSEIDNYIKTHKSEISDELADVMYWVLLISHDLDINLEAEFERKMAANEEKYKIEKSKGNHKKYTEL